MSNLSRLHYPRIKEVSVSRTKHLFCLETIEPAKYKYRFGYLRGIIHREFIITSQVYTIQSDIKEKFVVGSILMKFWQSESTDIFIAETDANEIEIKLNHIDIGVQYDVELLIKETFKLGEELEEYERLTALGIASNGSRYFTHDVGLKSNSIEEAIDMVNSVLGAKNG